MWHNVRLKLLISCSVPSTNLKGSRVGLIALMSLNGTLVVVCVRKPRGIPSPAACMTAFLGWASPLRVLVLTLRQLVKA